MPSTARSTKSFRFSSSQERALKISLKEWIRLVQKLLLLLVRTMPLPARLFGPRCLQETSPNSTWPCLIAWISKPIGKPTMDSTSSLLSIKSLLHHLLVSFSTGFKTMIWSTHVISTSNGPIIVSVMTQSIHVPMRKKLRTPTSTWCLTPSISTQNRWHLHKNTMNGTQPLMPQLLQA